MSQPDIKDHNYEFYVAMDKGDKMTNLAIISGGYLGFWVLGGLLTSLYVRSKYIDGDKDKNYYCM